MSVLDVVIALVFLAAVLYGLFRGFVRIAVGLAGVALSFAFAFRLAERGPTWFSGVFTSPDLGRLAAFAVVLVVGLIATAVVARLAARLVRAAQVDWLDRLFGGLMGAGGAAVVVAALLVGLTTFLPPGTEVLHRSRLVPVVMGVVDLAAAILPPEMAESYRSRRDALEERLEDARLRHGAPPAA